MHLLFDYDGTLHETMRIYGPAFRMACEDLAARGLIEPRHDLPSVGCLYGYGSAEELSAATYRITSLPELLTMPFV